MEHLLKHIFPTTTTVDDGCRLLKSNKINGKKFLNTCRVMHNRKIVQLNTVTKEHKSLFEKETIQFCDIVSREVHELDALAKLICIPDIVEKDDEATVDEHLSEDEDFFAEHSKTHPIQDVDVEKENDSYFS